MIGETVTRVRRVPGGHDPYGNPIPSTEERVDIKRCALSPRSGSYEGLGEISAVDRMGVVDGYVLYAPYGADITRFDRIEARGQTWEVEGSPAGWRSPYTLRERGQVVTLRRAEG